MILDKFQMAYYAHNDEQAEMLKQQLGLADKHWIEDIVEGSVRVFFPSGPTAVSRAKLRFCYAFPLEIEILTYLEGPHWHMTRQEFRAMEPFVSHIGFHMSPGEKAPHDDEPIQSMVTTRHTNEYVLNRGLHYRYEIYDRSQFAINKLGTDLKYIWRIEQ